MEFCYLRAGRGHASSGTDASGLDIEWPGYVRDAKAAGLAIGGYWRFYPSVDLGRQVTGFCVRLAAAGPLDLPPMVDIEDADGLGQDALTDWTETVLAAVQSRTAPAPLIYTNRWFLANALDPARVARWPLALAAYTTDPAWIDERAIFWQWAQNVTVPWAAGRVDLQRRRVG